MISSDNKPVASTWLDRLRLSRGFTTIENEDASGNPLTLRRNHHTEITGEPATSSPSDSPPSPPIPSDPELTESPLESGRSECYGVMTDVISELFCFRCSSRSSANSRRKFPRKQPYPRHYSPPVDDPPPDEERQFLPVVREVAASSRTSLIKKPAPEMKERKRVVVEAEGVDEEEEEEEGEKDLIGFSRSEVTVIDTSFKIWKSEKLVFRRRNVWKVKDNKGKSQVASLKLKKTKKITKKQKNKRKCDDGEIVRKSKKMKISRSVPDNNRRDHNEEVHDDPESGNVNESLLSRLPSKLRKDGGFGVQTSKRNREPEARDHQSMETLSQNQV